ncbi:MAG TPA: hypothetical protein VGQ20_04580 [Acidimicrobiales bacterium]|jgi:hypothetical protein|nr:hypothetical protein [Acidimicrobiales bacterium]
MADDIYTYRVDVMAFEVPTVDLSGFDVDATDGHIGKIDAATYDSGSSCLVVDTGFWIFGKKRMIPAGVVTRIDLEGRKVHVNMTKDEIKAAPDFDADRHGADERDAHAAQRDYYDRYSARRTKA